MKDEILLIAAQTMKVSTDEALKHCKPIPELNAYYFWNPIRGGIAVIIDEEGGRLGATSAISFEKHVEAFKSGRRN